MVSFAHVNEIAAVKVLFCRESNGKRRLCFPPPSLKMEPKTKGLKQQQQQHKKLLAAMLSQDSFDSVQSTAPSVTEEDIDNEDDAMELLGN